MEKKDKMLSAKRMEEDEAKIESDPLKIESISLNEEEEEEEMKEMNEEEEDSEMESEDDEWDRSDSDVSDDFENSSEFDTSVKFPPEWEEEIEKSPQYKCGMITKFVKPWKLESGPLKDDSQMKCPPPYRGPTIENLHQKLRTRIKAIRESRGYDVEPGIPYYFLGDPFIGASYQDAEPYEKKIYDKTVKFALIQINSHARAQGCGKSYELVEIEKVVVAQAHRTKLLTFRVKELSDTAEENMDVEKTIQAMVYAACHNGFHLKEWRFKPQPT